MSIEIKLSKKRFSYKKAMLFLNKRVDEVKLGRNKELIWILEHPKTFTAGISYNEKDIIDKRIKIIKTNRGGKITLHNPNQKIIYFVINLNNRKKDIRKLISAIENSIIENFDVINLHPSVLPTYKGLMTQKRILINNEKNYGFSIHKVSNELDEGETISNKTRKVNTKNEFQLLNRHKRLEHKFVYKQLINYLLR